MKRAVLTLVILMGLVLIGASWPSSNKAVAMAQKAESGSEVSACPALAALIVTDPRSAPATRAFQPLTPAKAECSTCCNPIKDEYVQCRWRRGGTACSCAQTAFQACREQCGACQCCDIFWDIIEGQC